MMMLLIASSFSQTATDKALEDNVLIVKTNFPKIYGIIVNEAKSNFYGDYKFQSKTISTQCLAFSVFVVLVFTDPPEIPRDVLSEIQIQSIKRYCKNFTSDTSCEGLTDQFEKLDCSLSYMIIDWISVMMEMEGQIKEYKKLNRAI